MPLTTYTSGEVLIAESLNDSFAFASSSPASGLVLISATTIGSGVASVTVTGAFSATYDNYLITVNGGVASGDGSMTLILGSTTANYRYSAIYQSFAAGTVTGLSSNSTNNWLGAVQNSTETNNGQIFVSDPFAAKNTTATWSGIRTNSNGQTLQGRGALADTTSYTAFTLTTSSGTVTGGSVRVYGYINS